MQTTYVSLPRDSLDLKPQRIATGAPTTLCMRPFAAAGTLGQKVETAQTSTDRRVAKRHTVRPHGGILLSLEEEGDSATCHHMDGPQKYDT